MKTNILRIIALILLLTNPIKTFSQDSFSKIAYQIKTPITKETVTIIDNEKNIFLFFVGKKNITYTKISQDGETLFTKDFFYNTSSTNKKPQLSSSSYLVEGNYLIENNPTLLFSNSLRTKFYTIIFPNSGEEKPTIEKFEIKNKKEKHFTSISGKNKVYIYKYQKSSSEINIYDISRNIQKKSTLDFSKERFYNKENKPCQLSEILRYKNIEESHNIMSFGQNSFLLNQNNFLEFNHFFYPIEKNEKHKAKDQKSDNSLPSSIEIASRKIKAYAIGNHHIITLNHRKSATRVISINSENKKFKTTHFNIPLLKFNSDISSLAFVKSNSFIFKNKIYQFICSKNRLHLSVHNLNDKKLIKEYRFLKEDELTILNAPIIQKGGTYSFGGERTLEKTSQLLRKLSNAQSTGLFVYENNGVLNLTLGGYTQMNTGGVGMMGMPGGFGTTSISGAPSGVTITNYSNPTFGAYNSYSYSKSVRAKCLFNAETFEHIDGNVEKNIFDKASEHAEEIRKKHISKRLPLETVFKYDDFFIQGYYNKKNKEYLLYKF